MADFSKKQGGKQPISAVTRDPGTSDVPRTGFIEPGPSERADRGPGPGNPANTRKIH